jgi:hypothetical protein
MWPGRPLRKVAPRRSSSARGCWLVRRPRVLGWPAGYCARQWTDATGLPTATFLGELSETRVTITVSPPRSIRSPATGRARHESFERPLISLCWVVDQDLTPGHFTTLHTRPRLDAPTVPLLHHTRQTGCTQHRTAAGRAARTTGSAHPSSADLVDADGSRPGFRKREVHRWVAFEIPNRFGIGYGRLRGAIQEL